MDKGQLDNVTQLLEEIVEDNTTLVESTSRILQGQDSLRTDVMRGLEQARRDFSGNLTFYAVKEVCQELLPPLTAIEAMLQQADFSDAETIKNHVNSLAITLQTVLKRLGLEKIPIAPGEQSFDPHFHLCTHRVAAEESPFPTAAPHTIIRVVENGYTINGRIISPVKVEVQL